MLNTLLNYTVLKCEQSICYFIITIIYFVTVFPKI